MSLSNTTQPNVGKERSALRADLESLLAESVQLVRKREQEAFNQQCGSLESSIVLYGAGGLGRKTLAGLRQVGIEPLVFADNNPALHHAKVDGLEVLPVAEAARKFGRTAAFITTIWGAKSNERMPDRQRALRELGCSTVLSFAPLYFKYPDLFLPHYACDLPHKVYSARTDILSAFDLWEDDQSCREFWAQVRWRALHDFDNLGEPVSHEPYFPEDLFSISEEEAFVDCGAYVGDTLEPFLRRQGTSFARIDAFEPDPGSFERLQACKDAFPAAAREKIRIHPYAIGARKERLSVTAMGSPASAVGSGPDFVECIDLDSFLGHCPPTYIKMDIEASEIDALTGARHLIQTHLPTLAICVYHLQDHLWRIPLLIRSFSPMYRFFLRPHMIDVWDLVCYAVPVSRLGSAPRHQLAS